jgi:hypothetical protein
VHCERILAQFDIYVRDTQINVSHSVIHWSILLYVPGLSQVAGSKVSMLFLQQQLHLGTTALCGRVNVTNSNQLPRSAFNEKNGSTIVLLVRITHFNLCAASTQSESSRSAMVPSTSQATSQLTCPLADVVDRNGTRSDLAGVSGSRLAQHKHTNLSQLTHLKNTRINSLTTLRSATKRFANAILSTLLL